MSEDLIKRQSVIATIEAMFERCTTHDIIDYKELMLESVKVLPSADIPQGWIPCEERLPEKGSKVITCDNEGDIDAMWYEKSFDKDICVWKDDYSIEWDCIVAWMPLPEPWEGADDE